MKGRRKEMKFQIRFKNRGGCSYAYADAPSLNIAPAVCAEAANTWLDERLTSYRPPKTVDVVEYDHEKKTAKRKGHRFKLTLKFIEATYQSGMRKSMEWYEPAA